MNKELDDLLQHHGVKGMKWGKHAASTISNAVKSRVDSVKREHGLKKTLKNVNNMTTKDIQKASTRIQLENDMKRLSKERKVGNGKDKKDYINRANMSDQELFRKVQRLRAKSNLKRNVNDATKSQKQLAMKVVHIAAPLVLQYALTKSIGKHDILSAATNAAVNLGGEKARLLKNLADQAKKVKHSEVLEDILLHLMEDEEILEHHGTKGMHWGVRKRIQRVVKAHRAKQNQKILDYHEKHKNKKTYGKLYAVNSKRYKTHLGAAKKSQYQLHQIHRNRAILTASLAIQLGTANMPHILKATNALGAAVRNPENIRRGKNIIQSIKRSPIRYVNGQEMQNVVN